MWQIFIGSFALSIIHALIPNHWLPLIAISKAEKWTVRESIFATLITGGAHMISTIILGILIGLVGIKLSESHNYIIQIVAPSVLVFIGIVYLIIDLRAKHIHEHHFDIENKKSKKAIILSLSIAMFFTPCVEVEAYYFQAAQFGNMGIGIVSLVYLVITLITIVGLVYLGLKGINRFNSRFMEHHAKRISGIVLILLGLLGYFVEI